MTPDDNAEYESQGQLAVHEAEQILPRLEREHLRFQIQTDLSSRNNFRAPLNQSRVELFIHPDDVEAWQRIRAEYFPV